MIVSYLFFCLNEKKNRAVKRKNNKNRIAVVFLFVITFNDRTGINAGSFSVFKNLFAIYPNYFNSLRNFVRLCNRCLVAYFCGIKKHKIGAISFFDQPSSFYSHMLCRQAGHFVYRFLECKYLFLSCIVTKHFCKSTVTTRMSSKRRTIRTNISLRPAH